MGTHTRFALAVVPTLLAGATATRVYEDHGRILLEAPGQPPTAVTSTGRDYSPWIDPEGSTVLFVRADPEDAFRTSVYAVDIKSRKETLLLAGPVKYHGIENAYIGRPELDPSGRLLFVISREGETTGALLAVDISSGKTRYIARASAYDVIQCGKHAGDLLVQQRRQTLLGHIYYVYWLYSPAGEDLGIAGPDGMDTRPLLDAACPPDQPVDASGVSAVPLSDSSPVRVDEALMARRLRTRVAPELPGNAALPPGVVRLLIRISRNGDVTDVRLISGDPGLAPAATVAVRQWKYQPWTVNGAPTDVVTTVELQCGPAR